MCQKRVGTTIRILIILLLIVAFLIPSSSAYASIEKPKYLSSYRAYTVMDARTGRVLMAEHRSAKIYPASTTKLVAAMAVLDKVSTSQKVKITYDMIKRVPGDAKQYGLRIGETYTINTLLHLSLISSYGDATVATAIAAYGSTKKCLKAMNKKVKSLGLTNTHFDNVIGLDLECNYKNIYTTSKEMALYTRAAMAYPKIKKIVSKKNYLVKRANGIKEATIKTTNLFYTVVKMDGKFYKILGTKTGTTEGAGHVFAATATDKKGHEVICTYSGRVSAYQTFLDIKKLLDATYKARRNKQIRLSNGNVRIVVSPSKAEFENGYEVNDTIELNTTFRDKVTNRIINDLVGRISYVSSDESVATVSSNGQITCLAPGETTITIKSGKTAYFKKAIQTIIIKVNEAEPEQEEIVDPQPEPEVS